jgi:hypothetical protein
LRIFPEQIGIVLQNSVRVRATITPAVSGVTVFFRSIDVDDPSANGQPVDNEMNSQDNRACATTPNCQLPNAINDGRFVLGLSNETSLPTSVSGGVASAEVLFEVTMQPGDNFRVVATCINQNTSNPAVDLTNVQAVQNDGTGMNAMARVRDPMGNFIMSDLATAAAVKASAVLTVWRNLHVEVDSMTAIPAHPHAEANDVRGNIIGIQGNGTMATRLDLNQSLAANDGSPRLDDPQNRGNGRFENGTIIIGSGPQARPTPNLLGNGGDYVEAQTGSGFDIPL